MTDLYYYTAGGGPPVEPSDETYAMATTLIGAVAYGPAPWSAEPPPPITAHVVDAADLSVSVRELDQSKDRSWTDVHNEAGTASLTMLNTDPDQAYLQPGGFIQYRLYGWAAFTSRPNQVKRRLLDPAGEVAQVSTFTGPGHISVFDKAPVEPSNGHDAQPVQEDRAFNWTDPSFDDDPWASATAVALQGDATPYWTGLPGGWTDPAAAWIFDHTATTEWAKPGTCYTRKTFEIPSGVAKVIVMMAADWVGELYLDGVHILSNRNDADPTTPSTITLDVTAGDHVFAASIENDVDPEHDQIHNPGGLLVTMFAVDSTGTITSGTPIVHTDATWRMVEFPPEPPGMTIGEILYLLLDEWQALDEIPPITRAFTRQLDSNGNPWPTTTDVATKVGTTGATFLLRELGSTYVDLWMEPGSWTLHAWRLGERGRDTTVSLRGGALAPLDPSAGNIGSLTLDETWDPVTSLLTRHPGGWHLYEDADAVAAYGRRRGTLGLGAAPSVAEVERIDAEQIRLFGRPRKQYAPVHRDNGEANRPWWAYQVRDRLACDVDAAGSQETQTVQSIGVSEDEHGTVSYVPVVGDMLREAEARHERALQKMTNGTLGGRSDVAQPVSSISTPGPNCCPPQAPEGGSG